MKEETAREFHVTLIYDKAADARCRVARVLADLNAAMEGFSVAARSAAAVCDKFRLAYRRVD